MAADTEETITEAAITMTAEAATTAEAAITATETKVGIRIWKAINGSRSEEAGSMDSYIRVEGEAAAIRFLAEVDRSLL